jgi:hypothetical protein
MDCRGPVQIPQRSYPSHSTRLHGAIRNIIILRDSAHDPAPWELRSIRSGCGYTPGFHEEGWPWVPSTFKASTTHGPGEIIGDPATPAFPCGVCSYRKRCLKISEKFCGNRCCEGVGWSWLKGFLCFPKSRYERQRKICGMTMGNYIIAGHIYRPYIP